MLACAAAHAESPDKLPKPMSYVSDLANVIDPGSKLAMEQLATEVESKAHATLEVVTIQSLDGMTIEEFTTRLEDNWKVGPKGTDKGVLIVFALKEHKWRIEPGYGLEGVLNDAKVGDIGRSMVPQLKAGQYGPAILMGMQQVANDVAADSGVTLTASDQAMERNAAQYPVQRSPSPWRILRLFLFIIIFFFVLRGGGGWGILGFLLGSQLAGRGGGGGFGGGGGGGGDDFGGGFGGGSGGGGASGDW
jgi:uncharacterized protein